MLGAIVFFIVSLSLLIILIMGVGIGLGYLVSWIFPEIDFGITMLAGVAIAGFASIIWALIFIAVNEIEKNRETELLTAEEKNIVEMFERPRLPSLSKKRKRKRK